MTRRRHPAAVLTPLAASEHGATILGGRTRREVWAADSADGIWRYQREESAGTPWRIIHAPTGLTLAAFYSRLDDARHDTHTGAAYREAARTIAWLLAEVREVPNPAIPMTEHDRARACATWLADHGHANCLDQLDRVAVTE